MSNETTPYEIGMLGCTHDWEFGTAAEPTPCPKCMAAEIQRLQQILSLDADIDETISETLELLGGTAEGQALLDEDARLREVEYGAMSELRAAAVAYDVARNAFTALPFDWPLCRAVCNADDRLHAAARLVAELEEQ